MGKKLLRAAVALLAAAVLMCPAVSAADGPDNPTIRVGLYYGDSALPGANLENSTGSGYRFGYYAQQLTFQPLGSTSETQISVVKTQNVSFDGQNYVDGTSGSITIGCYHLQLLESYGSFEEAQTVADSLPETLTVTCDASAYPDLKYSADVSAIDCRSIGNRLRRRSLQRRRNGEWSL